MTKKLDSIIELQPGFKTAVNLADDLDRFDKCAAYIPTSVASDILLDVGENLHVLASRRARLITGTYGTGKSHLALVLANLYRQGVDSPAVLPVMQKLKSKWAGMAEKIASERQKIDAPFLMAVLEGDKGPFNDSLLRALDNALAGAGLSDLLPDTAFSAAVARLNELREKHSDTYASVDKACRDYGFPSIEALEGALRGKTRDAYDKFGETHKEVCAGAPFHHSHLMEPSEVYSAVAKRLVAENKYAGIVVIWDEFGRYMERVLDDPSGEESRHIGRFAEACNGSQKHQMHLYLICHRSLEEYAQISNLKRSLGLSQSQQEDLRKETGRFRQFAMKTTDSEVFELMDQVIGQPTDTTAWKQFAQRVADHFDDWTDRAFRLRLFPDFTREQVSHVVTHGAYPLHPCAAYALPRISERVAQNERTLFTFLSDAGTDTLGEYLHRTVLPESGGRPPAVTADELWGYFRDAVGQHEMYRAIYRKYELASTLVNPEEALQKRIIKALAVLLVIQSDRTPCTEEVLAFALGTPSSELAELRESLKDLCLRRDSREAVLRQRQANAAYEFATRGSGVALEDRVDQLLSERAKTVVPVAHLRTIASDLGLPKSVRATGYSDDLMLERSLCVDVVSAGELSQSDRWLRNLGQGEFRDGYAVVVMCEDSQELDKSRELAKSLLKHPQILIGIPKEPVMCSVALRRHEVLRYLEATQSNLYGNGAELRDEWEGLELDYRETLVKLLLPLFNPESRMLDWFANGEELKGITSGGRLSAATSDMMFAVFNLTPRIAHERLTTEEGKDNFAATRKAIIDKLVQRDGPEQIHKETYAQSRTVIDFVYKRNGILTSHGNRFTVACPDAAKYPAMAEVWKEIGRFADKVRAEPQPLAELCNVLRRPPYGIRSRCISLLAAAVFRAQAAKGNLSLMHVRGRSGPIRLPRMDGEAFEQAFGSPGDYRLEFKDIGDDARAIVLGFAGAFGVDGGDAREPVELLPDVQDAVTKWWRGLPLYAQRTTQLRSREVMKLRDAVLCPLAQDGGDAQTILADSALDIIRPRDDDKKLSAEAVCELVSKIKASIEQAVEESLCPHVAEAVAQVFGGDSAKTDAGDRALDDWYEELPPGKKEMRLAGDASILTQHARKHSGQPEDWLADLAKSITGTPLDDWGDDMMDRFRGRLESAKRAIEEAEEDESPPVPRPSKPGQVRITVAGDSDEIAAVFVPVKEISDTGKNLRNILHNSVDGFRQALPAGELETILAELVKEFLG